LIFLYLFLLFFTVDATSLCIWFVKHLSERERCWLHENSNDINCPLEQWKKIKLIAERTEIVGQIIYFPLYIVIMIIVARSNYFDNWTFPTSLYIVIVLNIVISIICSYLLSKSAAKVKNEAINTLNEKLVDIRGKFYIDEILRHKQEIISKNLELIMSKINNIKSGAFCPLFQQPSVRASILFIGSCSIVITEYLRILK